LRVGVAESCAYPWREGTVARGRFGRVAAASGKCAGAGVTLLEVIIALGLMGMLLSGVYVFYTNILGTRDAADKMTTDVQLSRVTIMRIADDIREAAGYVPGFGIGLTGDRHSIQLYRYVLPETDVFNEYEIGFEELPPAKADLRRIEYRLLWDEEKEDINGDPICHGLFRTVQHTLNQIFVQEGDEGSMADEAGEEEAAAVPAGLETELMAPEIKYLEFEYFDGAEWTYEWKGGDRQENALPQAIKVTIGRIPVPPEEEEFDVSVLETMDKEAREELEEPHPDRFSVVVRLRHSDRFLTSRVANARSQMEDIGTGLRQQSEDFKRSLRSGGIQRRSGR